MYISGPWNVQEFRRRMAPAMQDKWMTAPWPSVDGEAVGVSNAGGSAHALLWDATTLKLTVLGEGRAADTNGTVQVGFSGPIGKERARAWFSAAGSELDLHEFLAGTFSESRALGIDENGLIVGTGHISGFGQVPIVWTPVPEPSTLLALATCLISLILLRRGRRYFA